MRSVIRCELLMFIMALCVWSFAKYLNFGSELCEAAIPLIDAKFYGNKCFDGINFRPNFIFSVQSHCQTRA